MARQQYDMFDQRVDRDRHLIATVGFVDVDEHAQVGGPANPQVGQRNCILVRSGAGETERLELLKRHREEVRRALAAQRECLKVLNAKIDTYSRLAREARSQA